MHPWKRVGVCPVDNRVDVGRRRLPDVCVRQGQGRLVLPMTVNRGGTAS